MHSTLNLAFDHLVHFIDRDPIEPVHKLQGLGIHAVIGGKHENWGTYNSLAYFDLTYLEYLAIEKPEIASSATENGLIKQIVADLPRGEGLAQIALRTQEVDLLADLLISMGHKVNGPLPGSRKRTDGSMISWKMLFVETTENDLPFPFFIQWGESDERRRADLQLRQVIASHPAGKIEMDYVAIAVENLDQAVEQYCSLPGLTPGKRFSDERLNATCQLILCSGANILLCAPSGPGLVDDTLRERGQRPFLVRFTGPATTGKEHQLYGSIYEL